MLRAQNLERTSLTGTFPAGPRSEPQPRVFVWDTGQQRSGWATVQHQRRRRRHADPDPLRREARAPTASSRITGYAPAGQIQTDYYIAKGTGTETFTPRFTYKGFQYVQISAVGGGALPDGITATVDSVQEIREPMRPTGSFDTSSDLLDLISRNIQSSIAENYVSGVITDTPTYEKNGWAGDAQLSVGAASLYFDTERHYDKSSQDMVDDQRANGEVTLLSPGTDNYGYENGPAFKPVNAKATPIWDAYWFVIPWETYLRHGDRESLARNYDGHEATTCSSGSRAGSPPTATATPTRSTRASATGACRPASTRRWARRRASRCRTSSPRPRPRTCAYMAKIATDSARALGQDASRPRGRLQRRQGRLQRQVVGRVASATTARTPRSRWCSRCRSCRWPSGWCRPSAGARCRRSSSTTCSSPARATR